MKRVNKPQTFVACLSDKIPKFLYALKLFNLSYFSEISYARTFPGYPVLKKIAISLNFRKSGLLGMFGNEELVGNCGE